MISPKRKNESMFVKDRGKSAVLQRPRRRQQGITVIEWPQHGRGCGEVRWLRKLGKPKSAARQRLRRSNDAKFVKDRGKLTTITWRRWQRDGNFSEATTKSLRKQQRRSGPSRSRGAELKRYVVTACLNSLLKLVHSPFQKQN